MTAAAPTNPHSVLNASSAPDSGTLVSDRRAGRSRPVVRQPRPRALGTGRGGAARAGRRRGDQGRGVFGEVLAGRRSRHPNARPALGRYLDGSGRPRELVSCPGAAGSTLLIDRDALTLGGARLVGHLGADEPVESVRALSAHYLADPGRGRCRAVVARDLEAVPFADAAADAAAIAPERCGTGEAGDAQGRSIGDGRGRVYRIEIADGVGRRGELRWCLHPPEDRDVNGQRPARVVSLREVIGRLESYEPACAMTRAELAGHRGSAAVATLRGELRRIETSRIVLNRALREAVLATVDREGLPLSEIALRCGRVKRDQRGNLSGETSWIARRIGLLPDSGRSAPSPWVHSAVLGLIARSGLGICPHEVELG